VSGLAVHVLHGAKTSMRLLIVWCSFVASVAHDPDRFVGRLGVKRHVDTVVKLGFEAVVDVRVERLIHRMHGG
jgi:hypothetical protein